VTTPCDVRLPTPRVVSTRHGEITEPAARRSLGQAIDLPASPFGSTRFVRVSWVVGDLESYANEGVATIDLVQETE
jgi:hypothetical protein